MAILGTFVKIHFFNGISRGEHEAKDEGNICWVDSALLCEVLICLLCTIAMAALCVFGRKCVVFANSLDKIYAMVYNVGVRKKLTCEAADDERSAERTRYTPMGSQIGR